MQGGYELRPGYEGLAFSEDGLKWTRAIDLPTMSIFDADIKVWEKDCIYQPWLVEHDGKYFNYYNAAEDRIEKLGLAFSDDLKTWRRYEGNPIITTGLAGSYNERFSSDIKVFKDEDVWIGFFFGADRMTGASHIMIAFRVICSTGRSTPSRYIKLVAIPMVWIPNMLIKSR